MPLCKTELVPATYTSKSESSSLQTRQCNWSTENYVLLEIKSSVLQQLFSGHHLVATDVCCKSPKGHSAIRQMLLNGLLCRPPNESD